MWWKKSARWPGLPCDRISSCLPPWHLGSQTLKFWHLRVCFLAVCRRGSQFCIRPLRMYKYFFHDPKCETLVPLSSPVQFVGLSALLPKTLSRPLNEGRSLGLLQQSGDRLSWKQFGPSLAPALPGPLSPMDSNAAQFAALSRDPENPWKLSIGAYL